VDASPPVPRPAVLAAVGLGAAFALLAVVAASSEVILRGFDRPLTEALVDARSEGFTQVMRGVSFLGSRAVLIGMLIALTVWALATKECARAVLVVAGVFAAAVVLEYVFKAVVDRPRPEPVLQLALTRSPAFPSGHALSAAAFYGLLPVVLGARRVGHVAAWTVIGVIGFSRVYLGVHWLTDVAGGVLLGGAVVAGGILILRGHRLDPSRCPGGHPR